MSVIDIKTKFKFASSFTEAADEAAADEALFQDFVNLDISVPKPEDITWLWPRYVPNGMMVGAVGAKAAGKSLWGLDICAKTQTGAPWPEHTKVWEPGWALVYSAKDDPKRVIIPRLLAAGGDTSRLTLLGDLNHRFYLNDAGINRLHAKLKKVHKQCPGRLFIFLDGIIDTIPVPDPYNPRDVGACIDRMLAILAEFDAACMVTLELNRSPAKKLSDRIANGGPFVSRQQALYLVHKFDDQRIIIRPDCINIGEKPGPLSCRLEPVGAHVRLTGWDEPISGPSMEDILSATASPGGDKTQQAEEFIRQTKAANPTIKTEELEALATKAGISSGSLSRARVNLKKKAKAADGRAC